MYVDVKSRIDAIEQSFCDYANDKIIISISTPNDETPLFDQKNGSIIDVLYLKFVDAEEDDKEHFPKGWIFTNEQAEEIADFVLKYKDKVDGIWVHCDAGVSRSAGVGAAILKWLYNDDTSIFDNRYYTPNMTVYRKTLNAFNRK